MNNALITSSNGSDILRALGRTLSTRNPVNLGSSTKKNYFILTHGTRTQSQISKTAFLPGNKRTQLDAYRIEEKKTFETLKEHFVEKDDSLIGLVGMCEGADYSDIETFADCSSIVEMRELKEMGSSIPYGFGFEGVGFAIIKAIIDGREKLFLQVARSYPEGYDITHQQLTPELYVFSQLESVKAFFLKVS